MTEPRFDVVGIGNAIVDVLSDATDELLSLHALVKGTMTLIDAERAEGLYSELDSKIECSGGSAANTMAGIASLGGAGAYIGKVKDDQLGKLFGADIEAAGVEFRTAPASRGPGTGRCLVLVTPDAQRTMLTYLGASATLTPADIDRGLIEGSAITYLEGYLWDPPPAKEAFLEAARIAHAAGREVALSLSDRFCVERHRADLLNFIRDHVDLLFANEDEVICLSEASDFDAAARELRGLCRLAALTRGAAGSVVLAGGEPVAIEAEPVDNIIDTTGAGDLYAAGFLYGVTHGMAPADCGRIGAVAAAEVISHYGARPRTRLEELIRI
jgi:sugar/nucleoside kinase (ribokinase family)